MYINSLYIKYIIYILHRYKKVGNQCNVWHFVIEERRELGSKILSTKCYIIIIYL